MNAPELAFENYAELSELIDLSNRLGRLLCGLTRGSYRALEVKYAGVHEQALRAVAASAAQGLLCEVVEPPLNLVNALHVASERGVAVSRVGLGKRRTSSAELVELELETKEGGIGVAGELFSEDHPRIVRIGEYRVDVAPRGTLLILRNRDVPGVIGRVGSVLGDAGVNIAEYHQARKEAGGEALAAVSLDAAVERAVIDRLSSIPEVQGVWQIELPGGSEDPAARGAGAGALQTTH